VRFRRPSPSTLFYVAVALFATAPAWIVRHPPMMDQPLHMATTRIIHDLHDPAFGFDQDFVLRLGRTQYVAYYLAASVLAYVVGVVAANVALVSFYLGGTVLALRALLRALRKDERLCLFVVPLLVNVLFLYGLFPFLLGIPVMLFALALAVRDIEEPTRARGAGLAALALALFYCHVFPFGVFAIGYAAMFPWRAPRRWIRAALPALPAAAFCVWWALFTQAGRLSSGALGDVQHDPHKRIGEAIAHVHEYFIDVFKDLSDDALLIGLGLAVLATVILGQGDRRDRDRARPIARAYGLVPIACVVLYFTTPDAHDYIALISQRFPIVFAITAIPLLRMPRGLRGGFVTAGALALALFAVVNTCVHFRAFEREDVGDFDGALAQMEPKKHVCALMFDRESRVTNLAPFLHFGSYYQLEKGGVVEFTYAGYAHWPVDFLPGRYPPPGRPARKLWEWEPDKVTIDEIHPYYDYVLTRGDGFAPPAGTYREKWRSGEWAVWERVP
jgi:hypothetical protein